MMKFFVLFCQQFCQFSFCCCQFSYSKDFILGGVSGAGLMYFF